ncbi:helix-turn-helix transcriptional regulator [Nocardioides yefusunii]|uniref:Helix-turn-helix transcriptional regulator n=1 Tax=Nocardioides yefusunii TaxID=2500546 RepID=A0ABW1QSK8_9ACTN|nr:WYL domain-containing protein [Nocardioides yefusunii]
MAGSTPEAQSRPERLMNLLIMLLVQDRYVSKDRIRSTVYGEPAGPAFDRMFDRDKELLRELGVPIETGHQDAWFEDEPGYRVRPDHYALPGIQFTADEASVVALAAKVWQNAALADTAAAAVRKLRPVMDEGGSDPRVALPALEAAPLTADEPSFETFWTGTQERRRVRFDYRKAGSLETERRLLEPWGVVRHGGRWYVVGLDVDRGEERLFRLSRVVGKGRLVTEPDAYAVPAGTDLQAVTRRLAPSRPSVEASVLVRAGRAGALRRSGDLVADDVVGPDKTEGWSRLRLRGDVASIADSVLRAGSDAYVEEPVELRDTVVRRLDLLLERLDVQSGGAA